MVEWERICKRKAPAEDGRTRKWGIPCLASKNLGLFEGPLENPKEGTRSDKVPSETDGTDCGGVRFK